MGPRCSGHTRSACGTPWVQSPVCPRLAADDMVDELARHEPHAIHIDRWEWHARDTYANLGGPLQRRRLIAPQRAAPKGRHARHASYSCLRGAWPTCLSFCPPAAIREPDLQGRPPRKPCPVAQLDTDVGRIMSCPHRTLTPGCPSPVKTTQAYAVGDFDLGNSMFIGQVVRRGAAPQT